MEGQFSAPFSVGSLVTWSADAPENWTYLFTPGPMTVLSARWDDGTPSRYSMQFGGIPRKPGWIITVEYDADATSYYDPPLSLIFHSKTLVKELHQMWLVQA